MKLEQSRPVGARRLFNPKYIPVTATILLFLLAFGAGSLAYRNFFSLRTFCNLFIDYAYLGVAAVGMTFVILSGGIDLSVGSIVALTTMICAFGTETLGLSAAVTISISLFVGTLLGFLMGSMIHVFKVPPFISTLAGMFFARGMCYVISIQAITINNEVFRAIAKLRFKFPGGAFISVNVLIMLAVVVIGIIIAHRTKFGRNVYAIGGNEHSAMLMGLPVGKTKIAVYTLNGFCSALSGVVFSIYMLSGYGLHTVGMEMDTIAAVVIGGTL